MPDPRVVKLAQTLVNYSVEVQPGDWVRLIVEWDAEPLGIEVYRAIIEVGGNASLDFRHQDIQEILYRQGNDDQLSWVPSSMEVEYKKMDKYIYLRAPTNTRYLSSLDPKRQQINMKAVKPLNDIRRQRAAAGEVRWTLTNFPCNAFAQDANMSLSEYEDFVYRATYADKDDPVTKWQQVSKDLQTYVDWLQDKSEITLKSPHADLSLSIKDRLILKADGHLNMPDGEVYTGPVEESVNGWVEFTYSAIREGYEVEGVRLEFKDGKVVNASAKKNEAYLLSQLDTDEGARYVGEFAIGTNYGIQQFTKSILYDEKIGGTFHMALGSSYPETGGKNESAIHWDMICDMRTDSEIAADGEVFYKDGQFLI